MRLRSKLFVPVGSALAVIVAMEVGAGIATRGAPALTIAQALVTLALGAALLFLLDRAVVQPAGQAAELASSITPDEPGQMQDELQVVVARLRDLHGSLHEEREQASEQHRALAKAQREAASANETKQAFLANITHEVRTPLNGLLGTLSLLSETSQSDVQRELVAAARDSASRLADLVEQVLDLTEASDGSLHLSPMELDLAHLFGEVIAESRAQAPDHHITYAFATGGPRAAVADPGRLKQILAELLKNATRAADAGQVSVAVTTATEGHRIRVRVEVEDDGPGIPPALMAAVFEPFTQVDNTFSRPHDGPGLGLALCRRLLERMGGELGVEPRRGGGSRFWFVIRVADPLAAAPTFDDGQPARFPGVDEAAVRVLVVEPDPGTASRLVSQLADHGEVAHVNAAEAGAVEALQAHAYELALVRVDEVYADPDMVQRLRQAADHKNQLTALVAITAATPEERLVLLEQGWDDAIAGPVDPAGTSTLVASWLVRRARRLAG
jgi:signal transduction histidine kinase